MCSCGFDGVIVRPKRVHKQEIHIFATYFAFQRRDEYARGTNKDPSRISFGGALGLRCGYFGVVLRTLGSLWAYGADFRSLWDHVGIIVESLWVYEGPFAKNTHFPNRF